MWKISDKCPTYLKLSSGPGDVNLLLDELSLIMPGAIAETFRTPALKSDSNLNLYILDSSGAATVQAALEFMTPGKTKNETHLKSKSCGWGSECRSFSLLHLYFFVVAPTPLRTSSRHLRASTSPLSLLH